jgi:hypothetical protein
MSFQTYLIIATVIVIIAGIVAIIRSEKKRFYAPKQNRGTEPGQGDTLNFLSGTTNKENWLTIQKHTRDPQAHAKAFVPSKARSK